MSTDLKVRVSYHGSIKPFFLSSATSLSDFLSVIRQRFSLSSAHSLLLRYTDPDTSDAVEIQSQADLSHVKIEAAQFFQKNQQALVIEAVNANSSNANGDDDSNPAAAAFTSTPASSSATAAPTTAPAIVPAAPPAPIAPSFSSSSASSSPNSSFRPPTTAASGSSSSSSAISSSAAKAHGLASPRPSLTNSTQLSMLPSAPARVAPKAPTPVPGATSSYASGSGSFTPAGTGSGNHSQSANSSAFSGLNAVSSSNSPSPPSSTSGNSSTIVSPELREKVTSMNRAVESGDFHGAIRAANAVLDSDRNNVTALYNRGAANVALERFPNASEDFSRVIQLQPSHAMAYLGRGNARVFSGEYAAAVHDFESVLAIAGVRPAAGIAASPNDAPPLEHCVSALHGLSVAHSRTSQFAKSVEADTKAIELANRVTGKKSEGGKDAAVVLVGSTGLGWSLAELYYSRGWNRSKLASASGDSPSARTDAQLAISDLSTALSLEPSMAKSLSSRAQVHSSLYDWPAAYNDYQRLVSLQPTNHRYWHQFAIAAHHQAKLAEAINHDTTSLSHKKTFAAYYNRALAFARDNKTNEAIADVSAALNLHETGQIDPNDPIDRVSKEGLAWAYCNRGIMYAAQGKMDLALKDWEKSLSLCPTTTALNARGNYYYGEGRVDEALKDWDASIRLLPNYLAYLHRANHWVAAMQPAKSLPDYDEAIRLLEIECKSPDKNVADAARIQLASALSNRAAACCLLARFDEALKNAQRAIELNPELASAHHNAALALEGKGKLKDAIAEHEHAHRLDPNNEVYKAALNTAKDALDEHIRNGTTPQPLTAEQIRLRMLGEPVKTGAAGANKKGGAASSSSASGAATELTEADREALRQFAAEEGLTDEELAWLESDFKDLFAQLKKQLGPAYRPGMKWDPNSPFKLVLTPEMKKRLADYRARVKRFPVLKRWKPGLAACLDVQSYQIPHRPNFAPLL